MKTNNLQYFLKNNKIKINKFCDMIHISRYCYYRWINQKAFPSFSNIKKIFNFTDGQITANDFYPINDWKKELNENNKK